MAKTGHQSSQFSMKVMIPDGDPKEIKAKSDDTILSVYQKIQSTTQISVARQELYFNGERLNWWRTLARCSIRGGVHLQLKLKDAESDTIRGIVSEISQIHEGEAINLVFERIETILCNLGLSNKQGLEMLLRDVLPPLLVEVYYGSGSLHKLIQGCPYPRNGVVYLVELLKGRASEEGFYDECASIVLVLCSWLSLSNADPTIHSFCYQKLVKLLEKADHVIELKYGLDITDVFPFVSHHPKTLCRHLSLFNANLYLSAAAEFKAFSGVLRKAINQKMGSRLISLPLVDMDHATELTSFHHIYVQLLAKMEQNLRDGLVIKKCENEFFISGWSAVLLILEELYWISKLYEGSEEQFWSSLKGQQNSLSELIREYTKSTDDYQWLFNNRDVIDSETRFHLVMLKIPKKDFLQIKSSLERMINWSKYLNINMPMVFENGRNTNPNQLYSSLREACQAIFNPHPDDAIFRACPNDPTRFYPNRELKLEPFHCFCLIFIGRVIALALSCKLQVGVAFDRTFLLQLAGKNISVEDIKDADPMLYRKCKEIREINDEEFDAYVMTDFLGHENKNLNFKNKEDYVNHLIRHKFVTSHSSLFAKGFDSIFGTSILKLLSCDGLEAEDINLVLRGKKGLGGKLMDKNYKKDSLFFHFEEIKIRGLSITNCKRLEVKLGEGSFGSVYKGLADKGFPVAIKKIELTEENLKKWKMTRKRIKQEVFLSCQLDHPNIVKYYGMREYDDSLEIFLELIGGYSLKKICEHCGLSEYQVSLYTKQMLEGLSYLHMLRIIHRDIKCANIMLDVNGVIKIIDFGLAKVTGIETLIQSNRGAGFWKAPEVHNLEQSGGYGIEADIWSLGCTVFEMFTGEPPYSDCPSELLNKIRKGEPPSLPCSLSHKSRDFIEKCFQADPKQRPTAEELLEHPFLNRSMPTSHPDSGQC